MSGARQDFPIEIKDISPEESALLEIRFSRPAYDDSKIKRVLHVSRPSYTTTKIRVGPKGYALNDYYRVLGPRIYNMPVRPSDTFVVTFPRSGTTWTQELVWLVANDLAFETAKEINLPTRFPFLEYGIVCTPDIINELQKSNDNDKAKLDQLRHLVNQHEMVSSLPSPRFIKTHLPPSLLPPTLLDTAKMVYVARNPKDMIVSLYYWRKSNAVDTFNGTFKEFFELVIKDLVHWAPVLEHVKEAWRMRHHPNMLFLFYEELQKDLPGTVKRVCDFYGKQYSEDNLAELYDHLSFDNFKKNEAVDAVELRNVGYLPQAKNNFLRKGKSGGWREYFDEELSARCDQWMAENLRDTDLVYPSV